MARFPTITLAILAGGKASRMGGGNKALLEINGQTFIERVHHELSPLFSRTIIIANDFSDYSIPNVLIYPDIIQNIGPMGGVHSALVNSIDPYLFITSCDMPFADSAIAELLSAEFLKVKPDILVPVLRGFNEPLFALYSKNLSVKIESIINEDKEHPMSDLFKVVGTTYYELPDCDSTKRCFTNINSLTDFNNLLQKL